MTDRLPKTTAALREGTLRGQHLGAQLYVSLGGEVVADVAVGESRPRVPMTTDTLVLWMSMGKPVTAILIARLADAGKLSVEQPVADFIPEFAQHAKDRITIAHLLTHSGGFRNVGSNWTGESWEAVISRINAAALEEEWVVGETAGYHTSSSWFILAEIARRIGGHEDPREMYRRDVFEPLGMSDCWVGMPRNRWMDYGTRVGYMFDTSRRGSQEGERVSVGEGEIRATGRGEAETRAQSARSSEDSGAGLPSADPWHGTLRPLASANTEAGSTMCRPGGNARGPMSELGRFYEQLLIDCGDLPGRATQTHGGPEPLPHGRGSLPDGDLPRRRGEPVPYGRGALPDGRFLRLETARAFSSCQLCDVFDKTFGTKLDWGYGFIINARGGRFPYSYGPHASADAFGHSGNQSTCAFADPARGLVVCWATNGMPGELPHQRRQRAINAAVYEDLGLRGS